MSKWEEISRFKVIAVPIRVQMLGIWKVEEIVTPPLPILTSIFLLYVHLSETTSHIEINKIDDHIRHCVVHIPEVPGAEMRVLLGYPSGYQLDSTNISNPSSTSRSTMSSSFGVGITVSAALLKKMFDFL